MEKSIEEKVDLIFGPPEATKHKKPRTRTGVFVRLIGAGGSITGLAKGLIVFGVTAALISTIIGSFIVSQQDDIALEGRLSYDLYVDGTPVGADDFIMPPDTFTDDKLTWGETETFTHTFMSPADNGNFDLYWDVTEFQPWLQPGHEADEFYGYEFSVTDVDDQPINSMSVMAGETKTLKFVHTLDNHFADTDNPLPYNFGIHVVEYVAPPTANDDTYANLAFGVETIVYPLVNDVGPNLVISEVGTLPYGVTVTIAPDGQSLTLYTFEHGTLDGGFDYTINSGAPLYKEDVGHITLSVV